ncbi:transposon Ty3-I Gag-Pol polyprotein [Trichonephila clavipes]|nr:transposon Ty3-I Gag-Pol polyprotein [Trichonephila clavipes]
MHCRECQRRKSVPQRPPGRLVPIPPVIAPFHRIGIDLLGRFPKSAHGNKWIIIQCYHSVLNDFDDNNITKIAARAEESRQLARVHTLLESSRQRSSTLRFQTPNGIFHAPGDLVLIYTPVRKSSLRKLEGISTVSGATPSLSAVTYAVQDFDPVSMKKKLREVVHVLRMKTVPCPAEQIENRGYSSQRIIQRPITVPE